jgi:hypothetical protein
MCQQPGDNSFSPDLETGVNSKTLARPGRLQAGKRMVESAAGPQLNPKPLRHVQWLGWG